MTNRIVDLEVTDRSTVPAEAVVQLCVWPESLGPGVEVRGRLMGPRCRFATTVEVAYHFRRVPVSPDHSALLLRAVVPEASLWDPQSPHLYQGPVELWQGGFRIDQRQVTHGIRSLSLGPRGLRVNGHLTSLVGRGLEAIDVETALALRDAGVNLLVVPVTAPEPVWAIADEIGFLVLGRLGPGATAPMLRHRARHPSCMGWILPAGEQLTFDLPPGTLLGAEGDGRAAFAVRDGGATLEVSGAPFGRIG